MEEEAPELEKQGDMLDWHKDGLSATSSSVLLGTLPCMCTRWQHAREQLVALGPITTLRVGS